MDIYSKLDTERFGIKIGKVNDTFFQKNGVENGISFFKKESYELVLARIKLGNIKLINQLENYGFNIKDIQHTYIYELKNFDMTKLPKRDESYNIREYKKSDIDRLVELARICFNNYGHYFNNEKLNPEDCLDVYGDWAYNSCIDKNVSDKIFVSEKDGEIVGYLSFKTSHVRGITYASGGMGAVDPKHRGKGVFQDIVIKALEWGAEEGFSWEEHNTLIDNKSVNRAFTRVGFKPENIVATLHGWVDKINI